jgi:hypothetical protein
MNRETRKDDMHVSTGSMTKEHQPEGSLQVRGAVLCLFVAHVCNGAQRLLSVI